MFKSFFPEPRLFFLSAIIWAAIAGAFWHLFAEGYGPSIGFPATEGGPVIGVSRFISPSFLYFYLYYGVSVAIFAAFWFMRAPNHPWLRWSILGSALILFTTAYSVEVSVAINDWYGPFYDTIQAGLSKSRPVTIEEFWGFLITFMSIAMVAVAIGSLTNFFVSHWIFRWRQAMNEFYTANWAKLRTIEGASQRVQEDTMRFSETMQPLAENFITAVLTLIAFMPILATQSELIPELPFVGNIPYSLVIAAIVWSVIGTAFMALIGIRLPGLFFRNQRVEAAYRKELVYGEDNPARAQPKLLTELFGNVRHNYFTLYFHYLYFNLGRIFYLQIDNIFAYIILAPAIVTGAITLGPMQQILNVFGRVSNSFQYLVNSWTTIVELISIYKRLRAFEAAIGGEPMPAIERAAATDAGAANPAAIIG